MQRCCPDRTKGVKSPGIYTPPAFGSHVQITAIDNSTPLTQARITRVQGIVGCILYYARAIDSTMYPAVTHIASLMANPTQHVEDMADRLLAYAYLYPNNKLVFTKCDMILHIQSDASYLSRPCGRSVGGGIQYLGNLNEPTQINGPCHVISKVIDVVVASAAESEYAGVFINAQSGEWTRSILRAIGHIQPPTIILSDNACAVGLATDSVKIKRSKSIDMRFHWIRDRVRQGHFRVIWRKGANNLADFFTKVIPVHQHQATMPLLVQVGHRK